MTKYILILYLCSFATEPKCLPDTYINQEFTNYYDCITQGYVHSYNHLKMIDPDEVNEQRLAIRFTCKDMSTPT